MGTVSSVVVHFRVAEGDASSTAGMEGAGASPTEGTCMALITSVCSAVVLVSCTLKTVSVEDMGVIGYDMSHVKG